MQLKVASVCVQVYNYSTANTAETFIVNMTVPNVVGISAATPGPNIIDRWVCG
jgi:hypothetical protein